MGYGQRLRRWLLSVPIMVLAGLALSGLAIIVVGLTSKLALVVLAGVTGVVIAAGSINERIGEAARNSHKPLAVHLQLAVLGNLAALVGVGVTAFGASISSQPTAAVGAATTIGGFMLIGHALAYRQPSLQVFQSALINLATLAAPFTAAVWLLGVPAWLVTAIASAWVATVLLTRWSHSPKYQALIMLATIGAFAAVVVFMTARSDSAGGLIVIVIAAALVFGGCLVVVSVWVRRVIDDLGSIDGSNQGGSDGPESGCAIEAEVAIHLMRRGASVALNGIEHGPSRAGVWVFAGLGLGAAVWLAVSLRAPGIAVAIAVGVSAVAFGASFVLRGEGVAVAVGVAVAAVWVTGSVTQPPEPPLVEAQVAPADTILVLGDSYSSGEGTKRYLDGTNAAGTNECRRSQRAYGVELGRQLGRHVTLVACSGAVAANLDRFGQQPDGDGVGRLPQLGVWPTDRPDPALVVLTIGGNDALFSTIGTACVLPGSCVAIEPYAQQTLALVQPDVQAALAATANRFTNSEIVVVAYPEMLASAACADVPLDAAEFVIVGDFVRSLNDMVQSSVATATSQGADNLHWFDGGRTAFGAALLCGQNPAATLNLVTLEPVAGGKLANRLVPQKWLHGSFHPTALGHRLMATALAEWIEAGCLQSSPTGCTPPADVAGPARLDQPCLSRQACAQTINAIAAQSVIAEIRNSALPAVVLIVVGWFGALAWLGVGWRPLIRRLVPVMTPRRVWGRR